jgi:hypothetical protein
MNDLLQLIDKRINRQMKESASLSSLPCRILDVLPDGNVKVLALNNNSEYIVPNYSGSDLSIGEEAQLFVQGDVSSGRLMYVGASRNKQSGGQLRFVTGDTMPGEVFSQERIISRINFRCKKQTPCLLFFNAAAFGSASGDLNIKIYIDEIVSDFIAVNTINANEHRTISFSLPEIFSSGEHQIKINACGSGNIIFINSYVLGYNIEAYEYYEPTSENDYIFRTDENGCSIIYYKGKSKCPEIPAMLQGKPVAELFATAFNYSDITNVYIPEGVEEIQ